MADNGGDGTAAFERMMARLDFPMFVVTTRAGTERSGCLVGFACQASIRPPRFLVGLSKLNHTYRVARRANHLAVHLLTRRNRELAGLFGAETGDRIGRRRPSIGCLSRQAVDPFGVAAADKPGDAERVIRRPLRAIDESA